MSPGDLGQFALHVAAMAELHRHDGLEARRAHHVDPGVGLFRGAAQTLAIHRLELLFRHLVHAHPAGMEGEALGPHASRARNMAGISVSIVVFELGTIWPMARVGTASSWGPKLSEHQQPVIIDNRAGAGGNTKSVMPTSQTLFRHCSASTGTTAMNRYRIITDRELADYAAAIERYAWRTEDFHLQEDVFDPRTAEVEAAR